MENKPGTIGHKATIGAIVVIYNPDWKLTDKALESLRNQVDLICVVDNTPDSDSHARFDGMDNIHYIPLRKNLGIAAAQNRGIQYLMDRNMDFALFTDQDSIAEPEVVARLLDTSRCLTENHIFTAVVGTRPFNRQTGLPYAPKSKEIGPVRTLPENRGARITEVYSVISSISLISIDTFRLVGGFDEALFIDGVDHEWCWRAWHSHNLRSFIDEDAHINHMMGEGDRKLAGKNIAISSSQRVYFQFRNFIWLCKRSYTPKFWKKKHRLKYLIKAIYYPVMVSPRTVFLKNIIKGVKEGLRPTGPTSYFPRFKP